MLYSVSFIFLLSLVSTTTAVRHIPVTCPETLSVPQTCFKLSPQVSESVPIFTTITSGKHRVLHKAQIIAPHKRKNYTPNYSEHMHEACIYNAQRGNHHPLNETDAIASNVTIRELNTTIIYRAFEAEFEEVFEMMPFSPLTKNRKLFSRIVPDAEGLWERIVKFVNGKSYLVAQWEGEEPLNWALSVLGISYRGRKLATITWKRKESKKHACALKSVNHTEVVAAKIHNYNEAWKMKKQRRIETLKKNHHAVEILLNSAQKLDEFNLKSFEYAHEFEYWTTRKPYKTVIS